MDFKELRRRMKKEPAADAPALPVAPSPRSETPTPTPEAETARFEKPQPAAEQSPTLDATQAALQASGLAKDDEPTELDDRVGRREILRFRLHDERFAVDLDHVEEIIKPRRFTPVPRTPDWILGILSLRGTMIPVIDLARRLGFRARESAGQRIIVVRDGEDICGLLVDEVRDVERIADVDVEEVPEALRDTGGRFLVGLVRQADDEGDETATDLLAIIDLPAILAWEGA